MEFNIGERVKIKTYEEMPEDFRNKGIAKLVGEEGKIIDKIYSEAKGCTLYKIHLDGYDRYSRCDFVEGTFDLVEEGEKSYHYDFEYLENLVIARLYEIDSANGKKTELAKGHGHIFHDGAYGIAQAASYALKRICDDLNGGSLRTYRQD